MLNTFLPSIKSATHDITEIKRLARLLWQEYVSPLNDSSNDSSTHMLLWRILCGLHEHSGSITQKCGRSNCSFCQHMSCEVDNNANMENFNSLKNQLFEKLDRNIRESMRSLLSMCVMMPGRVLVKQSGTPYAERLPYTTKFLLMAAFLCQNKQSKQDQNLFTTKNTGKSRKHTDNSNTGVAYAATSSELRQITVRLPTFPLERMLSVFSSIIGQYGQNLTNHNKEGTDIVSLLGTESLFKTIAQLLETGLIRITTNASSSRDLVDIMFAKLSCTLSRDDARVMASSVDFPLDKYCP